MICPKDRNWNPTQTIDLPFVIMRVILHKWAGSTQTVVITQAVTVEMARTPCINTSIFMHQYK